MNWSNLKDRLTAVIKANGYQEITGQILQNVLIDLTNSIGENYQFIGLAEPSTLPKASDGSAFYIATQKGDYANFNLTITKDGIYLLKTNQLSTWDLVNIFPSNFDYIRFNPTSNPALTQIGEMKYNPDTKSWSGKTSADTEYDFGLEVIKYVKNDQGTTINNGSVIYASGGQGKNVLVRLATTADQDIAQRSFAVATQNITTFGFVCTHGAVRGIDTSAFLEGDRLYLGVNGTITKVEPVAPTPKIFVGVCTYSHATQGEIDVQLRPIARLSKLSDVFAPINENGNVLMWNSVTNRYESYNLLSKINEIESKLV